MLGLLKFEGLEENPKSEDSLWGGALTWLVLQPSTQRMNPMEQRQIFEKNASWLVLVFLRVTVVSQCGKLQNGAKCLLQGDGPLLK